MKSDWERVLYSIAHTKIQKLVTS